MAESAQSLLASLVGAELRGLSHDLLQGSVGLDTSRGRLVFAGVSSSTLLGPWDGSLAVIESLELVGEASGGEAGGAMGGEHAVEIRLRFPEVPRHYRIVAREIRAG